MSMDDVVRRNTRPVLIPQPPGIPASLATTRRWRLGHAPDSRVTRQGSSWGGVGLPALCLILGFGTAWAADIPSYSQPAVAGDFFAIAETGGALQGFDRACSLNNLGRVVFIAQRADGKGVYTGEALQAPSLLAFPSPASNRDYAFVQLADTGRAVVRLLVSGPTTSIRLGDASSERRVAVSSANKYNSVSLPSVNNGEGVLFQSLESGSTVFNWNLDLNGSVTTLATHKAQGFAPRAMLDDLGGIVYRDPDGQTVYVHRGVAGNVVEVVAPAGFASGRCAGISDDSQVIVFQGEQAQPPLVAQPGIFLVHRTDTGAWSDPVRLAGLGVNDVFDPGEAVWTDKLNGATDGNVSPSAPADYRRVPRIQQFVPDKRCNVNRITADGLYRFGFVATVVDGTGASFPGVYSGTFHTERGGIVAPPKLVAKGGDSLPFLGPQAHLFALSDLEPWDAVNTRNELAFWSRSTSGEAVVKAHRIIDPMRQNDYPWGATRYASAELDDFIGEVADALHPDHEHLAMLERVRTRGVYTLSAVGCYITSTAMALEVLGMAGVSPREVYAVLEETDARGQRGITALGSLTRNADGSLRYRVTGVPTFNSGNARMERVFHRYRVAPAEQNDLGRLWDHLAGAGSNDNRAALARVGYHWVLAAGHRGEDGAVRVRIVDPWESWNGVSKDRVFAASESAAFRAYMQGRGFRQARILTRLTAAPLILAGGKPRAGRPAGPGPGNLGQGVVRHRGPVRTLLIGPAGLQVGWNSTNGQIVANLEGAGYSPSFPIIDGETELSTEDEAALVAQADWEMILPDLPAGDYRLEVVGLESGEFAIESTTYFEAGSPITFARKEPIAAGQTKIFAVTLQPAIGSVALAVSLTPDRRSVLLRWPSSNPGCLVQRADPLAVPWVWTDVDTAPELNAGEWVLTLPVSGDAGLFRLRCASGAD